MNNISVYLLTLITYDDCFSINILLIWVFHIYLLRGFLLKVYVSLCYHPVQISQIKTALGFQDDSSRMYKIKHVIFYVLDKSKINKMTDILTTYFFLILSNLYVDDILRFFKNVFMSLKNLLTGFGWKCLFK